MSGVKASHARCVNRADLLRALSKKDGVSLSVTAELCGFKAPPKRKISLKIPDFSSDDNNIKGNEPPSVEPKPKASQKPQAQYYRVIDRKSSDVLPEPVEGKQVLPAVFAEVDDLGPDNVKPELYTPPLKELLVVWAKLWPALRYLLSEELQTRQPDIPKLVRIVANGEWLARIPRKHRQRWTANVQLLVDRPERTCLFNQDYNRLLADLRTLRGETGLSIQRLLRHPGGRVRMESGKQRESRDWQMPGAGSTVFILSDLGLLDESGFTTRAWLKVGRKLRLAGCKPIALIPVSQRYLSPELVSVFDCVVWDRRSHLQVVQSVAVPDKKQTVSENDAPLVKDLLAWLSPAVRVEPALLRAVRHAMGTAGVSVEAAAWHHEDVVRSSIGFHFQPKKEVIEKYHQRLTVLQNDDETRELALEVATLILDYHRHVFPTQRYEEILTLAAMLGDDVPVTQQEIADAERHMLELVKAGLGEHSSMMPGIQPYLYHQDDRQPDAIKRKYGFYQAVEGVRQVETGKATTVPEGYDIGFYLAFVKSQRQSQRDYVLFQEGQQVLQLGTQQRFDKGVDDFSTGSALANFTTASGLMVSQITKTDGSLDQQILPLNDNETLKFPLNQDEIQRLDVAGQAITLERFQKPKWADRLSFSHQKNISVVSGGVVYYWYEPEEVSRNVTSLDPETKKLRKPELGKFIHRGFWYPSTPKKGLLSLKPEWAIDIDRDALGLFIEVNIAGIPQRFRWIEPTTFQMGEGESQHKVILTQGYWLAETTCTQALWKAVMGKNPSDFKGDNLPVENVSWDDVQAFIKKANKQYPDLQLRLPTESEWENACRAGTTTTFHFGGKDDLSLERVNYRGIWEWKSSNEWGEGALKQTAEVNHYSPNQWGLYQMHGNVWEWCQDWHGEYPSGQVRDPQGAQDGSGRVLRGGAWIRSGRYCRSAHRSANDPGIRGHSFGFRLARGHASPVRSGAGQQPIGSRAAGRRGGRAGDGQQSSAVAQKQTAAQTDKQPKDSIWKSVLRGVSGRKKNDRTE